MVLRICKKNQESVLAQVRNGELDAAILSSTNLVDDIILAMHAHKILDCLAEGIQDRRKHNRTVPYNVIWASSIAAKMRVHTSLTDIPYAITDHRVLSELGYTLYDDSGHIGSALMNEGSIRFLIGKYNDSDLISGYNNTVQNYIMPKMDIKANIHILDCTDLEVNFKNKNYEGSGVGYSKRIIDETKPPTRGYKLATLRGIVNDTGIIEDIRLSPLNTHDLTLSKEMLLTSPMLEDGDVLINDRGFLSRDMINYLKSERRVDVYVPLRKGMESYNIAVQIAKEENCWQASPIQRYQNQKITLVENLGEYWRSDAMELDVPINGCVIWNTDNNSYSVIITTDLSRLAKDIIKMYCLRPEIEEDYRQIKDFWKIEDFKSTKLNAIAFHIVSVLFGYLFFQLYTMLPEGEKYAGRSLPAILKNYQPKAQGFIVLYADGECGVITLFEMMELYSNSTDSVREKLKPMMQKL